MRTGTDTRPLKVLRMVTTIHVYLPDHPDRCKAIEVQHDPTGRVRVEDQDIQDALEAFAHEHNLTIC